MREGRTHGQESSWEYSVSVRTEVHRWRKERERVTAVQCRGKGATADEEGRIGGTTN
jgi:hypothetical protein